MDAETDKKTFLPTVILLLRRPATRTLEALKGHIQRAVGHVVAETLEYFGGNASGMTYYRWFMGRVECRIGTCAKRLRDIGGTFDAKSGKKLEWHDRNPGAPADPAFQSAWDAHLAWLYLDAQGCSAEFLPVLLRLAGELLDDDCLLIWHYVGMRPIRGPMALPTQAVGCSLAAGSWPT